MVSVLKSSASEAQKVEALQTAGIQSAEVLSLSRECWWHMVHEGCTRFVCAVDVLCGVHEGIQ